MLKNIYFLIILKIVPKITNVILDNTYSEQIKIFKDINRYLRVYILEDETYCLGIDCGVLVKNWFLVLYYIVEFYEVMFTS